MLRDTAAFWDWLERSNPTVETAQLVESWLSRLNSISYSEPSIPLGEGSGRVAFLASDDEEVIVFYVDRVQWPVDIVDLVFLGTMDEFNALADN